MLRWLARPHWQRGNAAMAELRWADARDSYRRMIRMRPRHASAWKQYGNALGELKAYEEALAAHRTAERLDPHDADAPVLIGQILMALGRRDEAIAHFERAAALDPANSHAAAWLKRLRPRIDGVPIVNTLLLGTTGLCNASCMHCPTGKAETDHVPRTPMPMPLFRKIIDGAAALDLPLGHISFGLFGDAFVDPFVGERLAVARARFPDVPISLNTNGAAYNRTRHAALTALKPVIGLHCESLVPGTYDRLMAPLRLERVIVKVEQLLEDFDEVSVSIPASRLNVEELPAMQEWFRRRGARTTIAGLSNRCSPDLTVFGALAFGPRPIRCNSSVLESLTIDSDGLALVCCQDFRRLEAIGDLREQTVGDVVDGIARRRRARALDAGAHEQIPTCSHCFADLTGAHEHAGGLGG